MVGPAEGMALGRPDRAGPDLRRGPRLPVGEGTQDCTAAIRLQSTMGRKNRQVKRRLGAGAGKGMTDSLQLSTTPRNKSSAEARRGGKTGKRTGRKRGSR